LDLNFQDSPYYYS